MEEMVGLLSPFLPASGVTNRVSIANFCPGWPDGSGFANGKVLASMKDRFADTMVRVAGQVPRLG